MREKSHVAAASAIRSSFDCRGAGSSWRWAFTLVELLVSMAVLSIFIVVLLIITNSTGKIWTRSAASSQMFADARSAFAIMTRRLSQATLNTYLDYYDQSWNRRSPTSTSFVPAYYGRASDLQFRTGPTSTILGSPPTASYPYEAHGAFFFAPLGFTNNNATYRDLPNLLNPVGYYVEFNTDANDRPSFLSSTSALPTRYRFRLVEVVQPSQNFTSYPYLSGTAWIAGSGGLKYAIPAAPYSQPYTHLLAENVIALVIRPELTQQGTADAGLTNPWNITTDYNYDSNAGRTTTTNSLQFAQLPPMLRIAMIAVDEAGAARLASGAAAPAGLDVSKMTNAATGALVFTIPANFQSDIQTVENNMAAAHVQFRTFTTVVALRAARWSQGN